MDDFKIYLPIKKSLSPTSHAKIVEQGSEKGETRTRYKIKGIASTTSLDRDIERVSKSCLHKMAEHISKHKVPVFGNHEHDWEDMLGYMDSSQVDGNEMWVEITTGYEEVNPKIKMLVANLEAGYPFGLSIGGKVKDKSTIFEPKVGKQIDVIEEVELLETSIVGIGSNPDAFLSLPDQISKSLKGGNVMEKDASSQKPIMYGKLGESTIQAICPKCGKVAELREQKDSKTFYVCMACNTSFSVDDERKEINIEAESQPAKQPSKLIGQSDQEVLGSTGKKSKEIIFKGGTMKKDAEAPAEEKPAEEQEEPGENEASEEEYKKFKGYMQRYIKEAKEGAVKAEGENTVPGAENALPNNTIEGKSAKTYDAVKKAFKENAPEMVTIKSEEAGLSFAEIRKMLKK